MAFTNLPPNFEISPDGSHAVLTVPLEKSDNDDRNYKLIRLSNDLEALLIQDVNTDKSGAALDVHVGNLCDPDTLPGLAHFCEHLLFMYLSKNAGHSNAYTSTDNTNFYFEVGKEHLEGALDRFSQFFISPLFDPNCKDREIKAVDSENKKNLQDDGRRINQILKSVLSNPHHPYSRFASGNLLSLGNNAIEQGIDVRDELLKWYDKYYSANCMKLCVLGCESLDQLTQWVVEKFSVWPLPDTREYYESKPVSYYSHLISHEGWANKFYVSTGDGAIGFSFFKATMSLTPEGLDNYREVIKVVFQYIKMIQESKWIFREDQDIRNIKFRFAEKLSSPAKYASTLASNIQLPTKRECVISAPYLIKKYEPKLIKNFMDLLRTDNFVLILISQTFNDLDKREKWFGTEYKLEKIDPKFLEELKNLDSNPELKIPPRNEFIPTNFETHKQEVVTPIAQPYLIKQTPLTKVWHKKDDTFWVPKAFVRIILRSPLAYPTPSHSVKTGLYIDLLNDALTEYSYDADLAGLSYNIGNNNYEGIIISLQGFNDKLPVLLEKIIHEMKNFKVDPKRFEIIKEQVERGYRNSFLNPPYSHSAFHIYYMTHSKIWTIEECLEALKDITSQDIQEFYPKLLSYLHIETFSHGNLFKEEALKLNQIVEDILQSKSLSPSQLISDRATILPPGKRYVYQRDVYDSQDINSAIEYYVQVGDLMDVNLRAKLSLLAQITKEPYFDQIRTKEQLGYLTHSGWRIDILSMGFRFIIQSVKDTVHLENRIEAFLDKLLNIIEEMTEEDYQKEKESLIVKKLEKPKNLYKESREYWEHIKSGLYDFDRINIDVAELRKITKSEVLEFLKNVVHPASPNQKKLSIHMRSQKISSSPQTMMQMPKKPMKNPDEGHVEDHAKVQVHLEDVLELELKPDNEYVDDIVKWKSNKKLGPAPTPVLTIDKIMGIIY
ncbi:11740_t:CDS:10 [Diversispora eburnea]|uniref:11740_t:CDS:1 n=1 Tax=Diversispora eburnea TaxID=1213867 RepID=A0A9N8VLL0_9GLOM|nr:11740_t:CDS:10 [Diversispora eburnea]